MRINNNNHAQASNNKHAKSFVNSLSDIISATATISFKLISNAMAVVIDPSLNDASQRSGTNSDNLKNNNNHY
jgi:hypothetical protein